MPPLRSSIPVSLTLISLAADAMPLLRCPSCEELMDLHQPDAGFPERMLWTCGQCAGWFLMDIDPEAAEAVLVCLPDRGHFLSAIRTGASGPGP